MDKITKQWIKNKSDELAVEKHGCFFDIEAAKKVKDFIERFCFIAPNKPIRLLDWQWSEVIAPLFGWKNPDGTRRFRKGLLSISKKNGKSLLGAAILLYMLVADGEEEPQVFSCAASREQAGIVYGEAARMIRNSPPLKKHLEYSDHRKRIIYKKQNGYYQALAAESSTAEGLNISCLIFDELHIQKSNKLWDALRYASVARTQPLHLAISTVGVYDPTSVMFSQWEYSRKILDGTLDDPSYYARLYYSETTDDIHDPKTWKKANPSLGDVLKHEDFQADLAEIEGNPSKENSFRRYRLNQWVRQDKSWLSMADWNACPSEELSDDIFIENVCYAGLDLAVKDDLSAFVLVAEVNGDYYLKAWFWTPIEPAAQAEQDHGTPYATWHKQGYISLTDGDMTDFDLIEDDIVKICQRYSIHSIAFDSFNAASMMTHLQEKGISVVDYPQWYSTMSSPSFMLERLIGERKIHHANHPVLTWNISNVSIAENNKSEEPQIRPIKPTRMAKIDGVVALIQALGLMTGKKDIPKKIKEISKKISKYNNSDIDISKKPSKPINGKRPSKYNGMKIKAYTG